MVISYHSHIISFYLFYKGEVVIPFLAKVLTTDMQLPVKQPSARPPPLLVFNPLRRRRSFGRPGRRRVKYDQAVALAATVMAILYAARKISGGEGLPWPHCGVCRCIFFVSALISLPSSIWSLILHRNHAEVWGRVAIGSALLVAASLLTDYFADEWKWASYLIWVLVCLPLIPSLAPLMTNAFTWLGVLLACFRDWLAKTSRRMNMGAELGHKQGPIAAPPAAIVDLEQG